MNESEWPEPDLRTTGALEKQPCERPFDLRNEHDIQIRAIRDYSFRGVSLYLGSADYELQNDGTWLKITSQNIFSPRSAAVMLSPTMAQQLADDLYAAGIRPTEAAGSAGALSAVNAHLKDLQKLVFERSEK